VTGPDVQSGRLLVVDDNPINRRLAVAFSRRLAWAAEEADSGERAFLQLAADSFDAVLLDISMPGLSGEEVLARLRAEPRFSGQWVVAYTAHALPAEVERLLRIGFDRVLVKPISLDALELALRPALKA
jgi:CheY-like chemotaxis protein